jgi:hypothetical protein
MSNIDRRTSPNQVEAWVGATSKRPQSHVVRITAKESIRSGSAPRYVADYEEQITTTDTNNIERKVWADITYP